MASILINKKTGSRRIQFVGEGRERKAVYLGKVKLKQAMAVRVKVESLLSAQLTGALDDETARWVAALNPRMREKLERVGLLLPTGKTVRTMKGLVDAFFAAAHIKPTTETTYRQTATSLAGYFGPGSALSSITPLGAEQWRQSMVKEGLAPSTISKRVKTARVIFRRAVKWKLLAENPFLDLRAGGETNTERMHFVDRERAEKVLAACPDLQWKLLFALSRYGGLRCPSEHLALRWEDINWQLSRITIRENKTKCRVMPLFPELRPLLREAFAAALKDEVYVITKWRSTTKNLRTQLLRIIHQAELAPWPKLFHNLRSTRQTELVEIFPVHVVCAWLGNSERIARAHYLQVRDEHFEAAVKSVHFTTQQPDAEERTMSHQDAAKPRFQTKNPPSATEGGRVMTLTGFEQSPLPRSKTGRPDSDVAIRNARESIPDAERMRRALAAIEAYSNEMLAEEPSR